MPQVRTRIACIVSQSKLLFLTFVELYYVWTGIIINDAIVVIDREQGGRANIAKNYVKVHSLFKISDFLGYLIEAGLIDDSCQQSVLTYIAENQVSDAIPKAMPLDRTSLTYDSRIEHVKCSVAGDLLNIMITKQTNLCLAADVTNANDILVLADAVGPYICLFKTHVDIVNEFSHELTRDLMALGKKHGFLIMEDRKFSDIGKTVSSQCESGFNIFEWANLVTAHSISGPGVIHGLKAASQNSTLSRGVFLVAQLSSIGALTSPAYTEETMKMASNAAESNFIAGIVCQDKDVVKDPGMLQLTPGCKIDTTTDGLGQQYSTPEHVVIEKGADIAVVGRGIFSADDAVAAAKIYRERLWHAYCDRTSDPNREIRRDANKA